MLNKLKKAARVTIDAFDDQLRMLLRAGEIDLAMAGVHAPADDEYYQMAVITFALSRFGAPANYQQLVDSYNAMKAQMMTSSFYTNWGDADES